MKHKLLIKDLEKLSNDIWQDEGLLPTMEKVNEVLGVWVKELITLYNALDESEVQLPFDTYLLGDVINFLGVIEAVEEK